MLGGGPWMVPVSSSPRGATVYYEGNAVGTTPCQVAMHGNDLELRLVLADHDSKTVEVDAGVNWWGCLNGVFLIPGILIGGGIDLATGNYRKVSTDQVMVSFSPRTVPQPRAEPRSATAAGAGSGTGVWGPSEPIIIGVTPGTRPWLADDLNTPVLPQPVRPK